MRLKWIKYIFIPFFCVFLMSHNTSAFTLPTNLTADLDSVKFYRNSISSSQYYSENRGSWRTSFNTANNKKNMIIDPTADILNLSGWRVIFSTAIPSYCSDGCFFSVSANTNFFQGIQPESNANALYLDDLSTFYTIESSGNIVQNNYYLWYYMTPTGYTYNNTSTVNIPITSGNYYPVQADANTCAMANVCGIFGISINFYDAIEVDDSSTLNSIEQEIKEQNQKENDAVDDISEQSSSDISNSGGSGENTQTTSLLNTLGSFLTAITNLQASNCNVVLAFPSFAGGSQTVNICQNKEYTGNIVSVAGSIILVMFYLPVAFMLVSKIYSEIRSFTNG